jgi:hypothetical protein
LNISYPEIPETSSEGYAGATGSKVKHANFLLYRSLGLQGPPGAAAASFRQPCELILFIFDQGIDSSLF